MKTYRKKCAYGKCGRWFVGVKARKYCKAGCKSMASRDRGKFGMLDGLKDMLEMELSYYTKEDLKSLVEVCLYTVGKVETFYNVMEYNNVYN